jgi:hypothetical protein
LLPRSQHLVERELLPPQESLIGTKQGPRQRGLFLCSYRQTPATERPRHRQVEYPRHSDHRSAGQPRQ